MKSTCHALGHAQRVTTSCRDFAEARVSISDEGPGIQKQDLPYVFERFYRGAAARAGAVPGIGLGLALSQAIVTAHGGHIDASSPGAGGALFIVSLPFTADAATTPLTADKRE